MDYSCVTRSLCSILSLLLLLSITPLTSSFSPSEKVTKETLDQLCSQPTIYKKFCVAWLGSDPKTFTLDIGGLIDMAIEKTEALGIKNREMIFRLDVMTDPSLNITYGSCGREYGVSILAIQKVKGFARSKDYRSAMNASFTGLHSIIMCEGLFAQVQQPIPAYVSSRNLMFDRMCDILEVFTTVLKV